EMRRRMVEPDRGAPLPVDRGVQAIADADLAALDRADVPVCRTELLRVRDAELGVPGRGAQRAGIADLPAALRVERRAVEDDGAARAGRQALDRMAVGVVERRDLAFELERLVAVECRRLIENRRRSAGRAE